MKRNHKCTCKIDTEHVNLPNSSRVIGGKRLSLKALVKAYSLKPETKENKNEKKMH